MGPYGPYFVGPTTELQAQHFAQTGVMCLDNYGCDPTTTNFGLEMMIYGDQACVEAYYMDFYYADQFYLGQPSYQTSTMVVDPRELPDVCYWPLYQAWCETFFTPEEMCAWDYVLCCPRD